ncbi:major facilitator superfamily multidrug-resistance, DHA1 sub-family [Mycena galericulata]|nr:major facilitator superfamily multidrug-resistance, DHA1 sub-family [Mycena galericulata]
MNDSEPPREESVKKRTPIPKFQVAILLAIQFAEPITALVIYPFVVPLIFSTGITGGEETRTGFYAGLLESAFFLAECLTVFVFGRLSDVYGRRPILLAGPLGLGISMLGFGLSKNFWILLFFRCIQGVCNGNIGVSKTVINEIADPTNIADIFAIMPLIWCVGATLAPLMGGMLADPATKWPSVYGKIEILRAHPYLLPCAAAASIALLTFAVAVLGLKETLPSVVARQRKHQHLPAESDPLLPSTQPETPGAPSPLRELLVRPLLIALANHGLLAFCHMANEALLPLFFSTPVNLGGLGFEPQDIGLIMAISGLCNGLVQITLCGRLLRRFGPRRMFTVAFCGLSMQTSMYPIVSLLVRRAGRVDVFAAAALAFLLSCTFITYFAYAGTMICLMDAAPSRASLGSVNGLAQMVGTVLRSLAPSFASSLFALSAKHHLAGGNMVYFVLIAMALGSARCSLLLPQKPRSESTN